MNNDSVKDEPVESPHYWRKHPDSRAWWYASVIGKLPRKRKERRFEVRVPDGSPITAREALLKLIAENKIREPRAAQVQIWHGEESEFIDSQGRKQTLVMRNIFPSGSAVAVEL